MYREELATLSGALTTGPAQTMPEFTAIAIWSHALPSKERQGLRAHHKQLKAVGELTLGHI
ncbi:MAG: hypothetical protein WBQ95_14205 [Terracidiphilus sp.]